MPSEAQKEKLSGNEVVNIRGFAIAYTADISSPDGHYTVGAIRLGPALIQAGGIPMELHQPILDLIDRHERALWGLPAKQKEANDVRV